MHLFAVAALFGRRCAAASRRRLGGFPPLPRDVHLNRGRSKEGCLCRSAAWAPFRVCHPRDDVSFDVFQDHVPLPGRSVLRGHYGASGLSIRHTRLCPGYVCRDDFNRYLEAIPRRRAVDGPQSAPQRLALRPPEVCELAARIYAKRLLAPTVNASFCILSRWRMSRMRASSTRAG